MRGIRLCSHMGFIKKVECNLLLISFVAILLQCYNSNCQILERSSYANSCETDTCSDCLNRLAYETLKPSSNQYNLQNAFFPPDKLPPIYVQVTYLYDFENGSIEKGNSWFWSTSGYYLYQPLAVLQFTSLFFC